MKKWIGGIVFACAAWAQPPVMTPAQLEAWMARDLRGTQFSREAAVSQAAPWEAVVARPPSEAVPVSQVQHRPPKEAKQALAHAWKLRRKNRHAEAVTELETAVRLDPAFGDAYQFLGIAYARTGRLAEAATSFRRVLELDPDNWRAHYNLGLALLQSGNFAEAEASARRALQLAPTDPSVNLLFGCVLSAKPEMRKQAVAYVQFAARTMPEAKQFLRQIESQ